MSPDGGILAAGVLDQGILAWDSETSRLLWQDKSVSSAMDLAFSPRGDLLASAHSNGEVRLWEASTGRSVRTFQGHNDKVLSLSFSPDGHILASSSADGTIVIWIVR